MADSRIKDKTAARINELMSALNISSSEAGVADWDSLMESRWAYLGRLLESKIRTFEKAAVQSMDLGWHAVYTMGVLSQAATDTLVDIDKIRELRDLLKKRAELKEGE